MAARRVCVFTGSRADYSSLLPVIEALRDDHDVELGVLASGGHLVPDQGLTVRQLESDGFTAQQQVEMVLASDTPTAVAKSFGLGVIGYADALTRFRPDILLVLGDRYEALAIAVTASLQLLPIAHVSGGEITRGSTDDPIRHAITKLAHLHFTASDEARQRVIQLGEFPDRVFATGAPTLDTIRTAPLWDRGQVATTCGIELRDPVITVTYHPVTADPAESQAGLVAILEALDQVPDASVVFTGTNVDQGGHQLVELIRQYVDDHGDRMTYVPSLGKVGYLSLASLSAVVIGNSSSGIVEAPALRTVSVNVGSRQQGRPRAESTLDSGNTAGNVRSALAQALTTVQQKLAQRARSPYGDGHAADRITRVLKDADLRSLIPKSFFDIPAPTDSAASP